tara:strand:- start:604 stop:1104 length:501 start_codon:yes stop_codon:yes gene_type:complete
VPIDDTKLSKEYKSLKGRVRFRFFTVLTMPAAWFAGLRLDNIDDHACGTSLPGGWRTQNPFKTMYWAVQGMGAELATGAVPFAISRSMSEKLRMFVVGTEAKFVKRAKGRIKFTCDEAMKAREAIEESMKTGEPIEIDLRSVGRDDSGEVVSEWIFRWNFLVLERS